MRMHLNLQEDLDELDMMMQEMDAPAPAAPSGGDLDDDLFKDL